MEAIFRKIVANSFSDVAGLTAHASIPMSQALINEILLATLRGNQTIEACQVSIQAQNHVSVRLKTTMLPWALNLKLKLDHSVDLASFSSPKMRAWLENHLLLGSLGSLLNALPAWAKLYGNQLVVDLGFFLSRPEEKQLLGLIKSAQIRTEEGKVIFDVKIEVDE